MTADRSSQSTNLADRKFVRRLITGNKEPVVLVGSAARWTERAFDSDIDLLAIGTDIPSPKPPGVQVISYDYERLKEKALNGDDFVQWALRYGRALSGHDAWTKLREELLPRAPWPDPQRNEARARKRVSGARALLEMGDLDAASEELLFALSQLARALLLRNHVFPLSRPELPAQLDEIGEATVAADMRHLRNGGLSNREAMSSIENVESALASAAPGATRKR